MRSDADLLVPLPVGYLVLCGAVAGLEATAAQLMGGFAAARKGAGGGRLGGRRGHGQSDDFQYMVQSYFFHMR